MNTEYHAHGYIYDDYRDGLCLTKEQGYPELDKMDISLVRWLGGIKEIHKGQKFTVDYYINDKPIASREEADAKYIKKMAGDIEATHEEYHYEYSSWTSGTDYENTLKVGGHDLAEELELKVGKYCWITVRVA